MSSVSQEHLLPQVEEAIKTVLQQSAQQVARSSGFVQRQSRSSGVTGASFVQMLVLGWMSDPNATLDALVQFGADLGIRLSPQGLAQRFTRRTATFLQQVFEVAIAQVVVADPVALPLLDRFAAVVLEDSSSVRLPDALRDVFAGCGGSNAGRGTSSAFKLFVRLDMLRGRLDCSRLLNGRTADTKTPFEHVPVAKRTLHIRDRGFADLDRWKQEAQRGEEVVSYYKMGLRLFDEQGQRIDVEQWLSTLTEPMAERQVVVGVQAQLPMRLVVERLPEPVRVERVTRLREEARKQGHAVSRDSEKLAGWTLILTTAGAEMLSAAQAIVVLRLRWQIELLFKLWKQHGQLDCWRSQNVERIHCEVYGKLIGLLLQHWMLIVGCWQEPHRSLVKAAKAVRTRAILVAVALTGGMEFGEALRRTQRATQQGSRLNTRNKAPTTSQMLMTGISIWTSKPRKPKKRGRKKLSNS
ncbi:MAG: IS4 family transposase [Ktedonobacteraceae bacterium]|nr:IS4 family transposase [Ktedonobacteraceae bacterium]